MNVLFLTYHTCIRAIKESFAVMGNGHGLYFLQVAATSEELLISEPFSTYYRDLETLAIKLPMFRGFDLVHVHNDPNWMVRVVNEVLPGKPVILDCHDLNSMREGIADDDERYAVTHADGLIFPSIPYMKGAIEFFPEIKSKPMAVIESRHNRHHIVNDALPGIPGIVYEGAMFAASPLLDPVSVEKFRYRDYTQVFDILSNKLGIPTHLYGVKDPSWDKYVQTGAVCHRSYPYTQMLKQISRYDWGFCGSPIDHPQWHMAMPNKLFDYIAAGIPVIVYKADESAKFVREHGLGIVIEDLEELADPEVYGRHEEIRPIVQQIRHDLVMELQAPIIMKIYEQVLLG